MAAVGLLDLEDLNVGMVARQVGLLDELEPVELFAQGEDAVADVVELKIGAQGRIVERVLLLAQALGVEPPIPGRELGPRRPALGSRSMRDWSAAASSRALTRVGSQSWARNSLTFSGVLAMLFSRTNAAWLA